MNPTVTFEDVLKKLINQTTQAGKPTALIKGEVTSVSPVTVKVEGGLKYPLHSLNSPTMSRITMLTLL